jgi:hypothetical protein
METNWAAEQLQTIRMLMERSALYRRALAPVMILCGALGSAAAVAGLVLKIDSPRSFILFWTSVAVVALAGSFLLVRRQALRESESFWSPPTRRIVTALLPPLAAGFAVSLTLLAKFAPNDDPDILVMFWLPLAWVVLYGCALCAAGFFTSRGLKLFGWVFILAACGLFALGNPDSINRHEVYYSHGIMGFFFGVLHLAYGVYLYFTEQRKKAA